METSKKSLPKTKALIISIILLISGTLSGCKNIEKETTDLINDSKKSIDNVVNEAEKVKNKAAETVNDLKKAGEAIGNAASAIEKIGK